VTLAPVEDLTHLLAGVDRARLVERFGTEVQAWCAELPTLVGVVSQAWWLRVEPPHGGERLSTTGQPLATGTGVTCARVTGARVPGVTVVG
jgi:hypothetical protein